MRKSYYILGLVVFASFILYFFYFKHKKDVMPPAQTVEIYTTSERDLINDILVPASVKASKEAHLQAEKSGILEKTLITEGQKVVKDQLLGHLQNVEVKKKAELARKNADLAQSRFDRAKVLFEGGNLSKQGYEESATSLSDAQSILFQNIQELRQTEFRAPFDGTVGVFKKQVGERVEAGDLIISVFDRSSLSIDFYVSEHVLNQISIGDQVVLTDVKGEIFSISEELDSVTQMALIRASVPFDVKIRIGSVVDIGIILDQRNKVIAVPNSSVLVRNQTPSVMVVQDGKIALKTIETDLQTKNFTQVKSGLNLGDQVILLGQENFWEGMPVEVIDQTAKYKDLK